MNKRMRLLTTLVLWWLAAVAQAGTHHYYYTDPQGTVLAKADASGTIIATYDYAPYGAAVASMSPAPNGPGYTGHVNDPESGLVYMQARYYDPAVGRFLSVDPVGPAAGNGFIFNRFQYADNNPVGVSDPTGQCGEVSGDVQRLRNLSDVSMGGHVDCFVASEGQVDFGTTLGSVPGYSETGGNSWRANNDWAFYKAATSYNSDYNLTEGDDAYMDAKQLKAWAMVESGGANAKSAFLSDPLQVNNSGDWSPEKSPLLGLTKGQKMDASSSAAAGLLFWRHKGYVHDRQGSETSWRGNQRAFELYNRNDSLDKNVNGAVVPHYKWYGQEVIKLRAGM